MRAEIIAIGDELTTGQRLDTNSQWLSQRLTEMGVQVAFHTTIGDEIDDNVAAFRLAIERADVVVSTGGLGPTADDLTRDALAAVTGCELELDEASLKYIEGLFASRSRTMPEKNRVQAYFPAGAKPVHNPNGTAPGIEMEVEGTLLFALPGVPAEMHEMWEETVVPRILEKQPEPRVIRHHRIKCFGAGESAVEAMLPDLIRRDREPRVGITASDATITLRITATGASEEECREAMQPTIATIYESLGNLIFGEEDDELHHIVLDLLKKNQQTLAVAEWATEGLVGDWLQESVDGETIVAARETLGGSGELPGLDGKYEQNSQEAAISAAEAIRGKSQADIGLGISAFPQETDRNSYVYIALATEAGTRKLRYGCAAHPAIMRSRTAKQALNALRLMLTGAED